MSEVFRFDHLGVSASDLQRYHRFHADSFGFDGLEDEFQIPAHDPRGRVLVNAAGARAVMEPRIAPDGRSRVAFVADPDGNLIDFLQRPGAA